MLAPASGNNEAWRKIDGRYVCVFKLGDYTFVSTGPNFRRTLWAYMPLLDHLQILKCFPAEGTTGPNLSYHYYLCSGIDYSHSKIFTVLPFKLLADMEWYCDTPLFVYRSDFRL